MMEGGGHAHRAVGAAPGRGRLAVICSFLEPLAASPLAANPPRGAGDGGGTRARPPAAFDAWGCSQRL